MLIEFEPTLTKDFILQRVSQEEIFEEYGEHVTPFMHVSTLRTDHKPTCKFYRRTEGKLMLRDYSGDFWGDCFDYVQRKTGLTYHKALADVARRFGLINGTATVHREPIKPNVYIEPETCKIRVKRGKWTPLHLKFWEVLGVSRFTLDKFNVAPLERAWVNDNQIFWNGNGEIAFVYYFPEYGQYEYKLYFPFREKFRFVHASASVLQGWGQLPAKGDFLLVTKSYKDVIALYEFGVPAIAPMTETLFIMPAQAEEMMKRFPRIFCMYDTDQLAGIRSMQYMKRQYGWQPVFFNVRKGHPKDFTEYIPKFGIPDTRLLVDNIKDTLL